MRVHGTVIEQRLPAQGLQVALEHGFRLGRDGGARDRDGEEQGGEGGARGHESREASQGGMDHDVLQSGFAGN
jgi:hypothetical protein